MEMEIVVKESVIVRPAHETPQRRLKISELDMLVPSNHANGVYFYRRQPADDDFNFFEPGLLKEALSKVLVPYYPMAGRLGMSSSGHTEIHCNGNGNGVGALFVSATTSSVLDDFGDFGSSFMLQKLVPGVDYTDNIFSYPLLLTQVTHFKCGGVCLGVGLQHTLADATSTFQFVEAWAEMTRGVRITTPPPCFDHLDLLLPGGAQGVPPSPKFRHPEYDPPPSLTMTTNQKDDPADRNVPVSSAVVTVSVEQLNKLRGKLTEGHDQDTTAVRFTRFEVLVAHMWRCLCKARGLPDEQPSKIYIPINGRSRLNPPLPPGYIGNVLFTGTSIALSGELQSEPFSLTAQRIHKALKRMDDEYLKSALAFLKQQPDLTALRRGPHTFRGTNFNVSNLFHMPIYEADFGWGRPNFFRPVIVYDGLAHILPSPSGDGGLYFVLSLETQHLNLFKKLFFQGL